MITQEIKISFASAMAETIRIHTTEVGREIVFEPDIEIPSTYNADIVIVKPDNTFVIERGSIFDGKILVEIPEQAGAVSGVGGYILKIYDNDLCVYSASGGLIVDDHLLMNSMIESVAEVYGYNFPQDFALKTETATLNDNVTASNSTWSSSKISEEIAAASPDIIDDNEVLYDKTWSSEKISNELGNIPSYHVYSQTEQPVGRWIDGKTVYEKTYVTTGNSTANITLDNTLTFANNTLVGMAEIITVTHGAYNTTYATTGPATSNSRIVLNEYGLLCSIEGYRSEYGTCDIIVTVRYIKTNE